MSRPSASALYRTRGCRVEHRTHPAGSRHHPAGGGVVEDGRRSGAKSGDHTHVVVGYDDKPAIGLRTAARSMAMPTTQNPSGHFARISMCFCRQQK